MESSLECGVCLSEYNSNEQRPKSLPCGHTVCSSCVRDNLKAKDGKMSCPFCRTPCGTGVKTLNDFPTTFALLSLLGTAVQKSPSKTLSPKEKEKKVFQDKKKAEFDNTKAHISNCNEHLQGLRNAIETQDSTIKSIRVGKNKLLEDYQLEQNKLDEAEETASSTKDQLDNIVAEGNDIVKGLEALQGRVQSASSLFGLNMVSQDVQRYNAASQEWVTTRVDSIIKDTYLIKQNKICTDVADNGVTQRVECQRKFEVGELHYSCLQCRTEFGVALCGSCFVNSEHLNHEFEIRKSAGSGGYCDCGISEVWKRGPICFKHLRKDTSPLQAFDKRQQSSVKCNEVFVGGEKYFSCLDCRSQSGVIMCGTCFLNSSHKDHRYEIITSRNGGYCDCGCKEAWKRDDTCKIHK